MEISTALLNGAILTGKHFSLRVAPFLLRLAAISEILKYILPKKILPLKAFQVYPSTLKVLVRRCPL